MVSGADERFWILPGGGVENGETLAQAAERELREETGLCGRALRALRIPSGVSGLRGYSLVLIEVETTRLVSPRRDVDGVLREVAWHKITPQRPIGGLNATYWLDLAPLLRSLAGR